MGHSLAEDYLRKFRLRSAIYEDANDREPASAASREFELFLLGIAIHLIAAGDDILALILHAKMVATLPHLADEHRQQLIDSCWLQANLDNQIHDQRMRR